MRQTQGVLWTKGVLLTPQHLQIQDRFLEDTAEFRLSSLSSFPWGYTHLEIDREALAEGSFVLNRATGIFRDGLPFDIPGSDPAPAPKPLEGLFPPDQRELELYLAMPERRSGERSVSTTGESRDTPYVARPINREDENTGLAQKPIMVAQKNFRIIASSEYLEGSSTLPVARIRKTEAGQIELDPDFVPPVLSVAASTRLMAITRRLVELLVAKSNSLSGIRRERNKGLASFGVSDVANFWLLYSTNRYLPEIRHLQELRKGHPERLYASMLGLAGALTTFSSSIHPTDLPPYRHDDLSGCFGQLDSALRVLLETVVPSNHVSIPLEETRPSMYVAAIDQDRYLASPEIYLAVASGDPDVARITRLLKVSSADRVDQLVRQALGGIEMRHVREPRNDIPVKLDYHYFLLNQASPEWESVRRARNIAAYVPAEIPDARLELVIVLPK